MRTKDSIMTREPIVNVAVRLPVSAYQRVVRLAQQQGATTLSPTLRDLVIRSLDATEAHPQPAEARRG